MWTWKHSEPCVPGRSYLVSVRRADIELVSYSTFNSVKPADHELVLVSLHLGDKPRLAGY